MNAPNRRLVSVVTIIGLLAALASLFAERWFEQNVVGVLGVGWQTLVDQRIGSVGAVFVLGMFGALAISFVDTSPNARALEKWLRTRLRSDYAALSTEAERLKHRYWLLRWHHNWGGQQPDIGQASPEDLAFVIVEIARLDTVLKELGDAMSQLKEELITPIYGVGPENGLHWTGAYFYDKVWNPARYTLTLTRFPKGKDGDPDEDVRAALKAFLKNYDQLRLWFARLARMQHKQLTDFETFGAWQKADAAFYAKLKELPNLPAMQEMRYAVSSHIEHRDSPEDLLTITPPAPKLEGSVGPTLMPKQSPS